MYEEKKKKFSPPTGLYKPKFMTQDEIQNSLKGLSEKVQKANTKENIQRAAQSYPKPRFGQPQKPFSFGQEGKPFSWTKGEQKPFKFRQPMEQKSIEQQIPVQEKQEQEIEEEPYWNPQDWEQWALDLYNSYPETRKFLPDWFIKAVEAEEQTK